MYGLDITGFVIAGKENAATQKNIPHRKLLLNNKTEPNSDFCAHGTDDGSKGLNVRFPQRLGT